ncbi:hypothetical protein FSP39_018120 [Pinctada imbricata]|uniref:Uncharacterized protein n=1 Tax=Pinctada imbricata TaxID=66713 RepID=A0AA88Y015_PINIB|nr:hypothetical protein FSP39_018120 [Pinctada imbricata]
MLQSLQTKHLNYISDKLEFDCASKELQVFFLQYALTKKKEKLALTLTEHLGDMSNIVTKGESFLHQSASLSVKITDKLLRHCHLNPVIADITGRLPFHVACKSGSAEQISLLYDNAVTDDQLRIGLKIALRYRKFEFCPHILSLRPELIMDEEIICTVRTMLNQLIEKYRRKSGLKLKDVEEKAKYLLPILSTEKNALGIYMFDCAYFGMHSTMEYLIDQGIDTNICDYMERTPLHEASQQNHIKCVEILLKNNARINSVDQRRSSALHYACEKGHLNVVKCLIEHGASIDAQDVCGRTCFMLSIYRGRHDISNYLVKKHAHKLGLWKSDMSGLSTLSYSSLLPEESFEILLEEFANARKDKKAAEPPEEDEVSKRSENNQIEGQSWIWQMHDYFI